MAPKSSFSKIWRRARCFALAARAVMTSADKLDALLAVVAIKRAVEGSYETASARVLFETLGKQGVCVSICYGPSAGVLRWTAQCLRSGSTQEFIKPYEASSLIHALMIAHRECHERGWVASPFYNDAKRATDS